MTATPPILPSILPQNSYLGPAKVLAVHGEEVDLECPDAFPRAKIAIAPRYRAEVGDIVLAVGNGGQWYVIGVLEGRGTTELTSLGDLVLAAPAGKVEILAAEKIELKSKRVQLVGEEIELVARHMLQRVHSLSQWIVDGLHQRIGRVITTVQGAYHIKANRITQRADEDVKVNGRSIHLN